MNPRTIHQRNLSLRIRYLRWLLGLLIFFLSISLLVWGSWPQSIDNRSVSINSAPAALPDERTLTLAWPAWIRAGDSGMVRLVLEPLVQQASSAPSTGQTESNVLIEARLDLAGIQYAPLGEVSQVILPGRPVLFSWELLPVQPGVYRGDVWIHVNLAPGSGGQGQRYVLTAQKIEIVTTGVLGFKSISARLWGTLGIIIGLALCLDGMVSCLIRC
jgi:hypothetical protein